MSVIEGSGLGRPYTNAGAPSNGTTEVQTLTIGGTPTAGSMTFTYGGQTSAAVTWTSTDATLVANIDAALEALDSIGVGGITAAAGTVSSGIGTITLTFAGQHVKKAQTELIVANSSLTGTAPTAVITRTTTGVTATGRGAVLGGKLINTLNGVEYANKGTGAAPDWRTSGVTGYTISPAVGAATAVHAAVTDTAVQVVVTTAITNPDYPRNVTATAGGTSTDIKAIQVIVAGTDIDGNAISETLPAFTVNTAGIVTGSKAFKTVTSITIPAHDGTGATTAIGTGAKLGLPIKMHRNGVIRTHFGGVVEATAATVAFSSTALESNTATLNSTLDASQVIFDIHDA